MKDYHLFFDLDHTLWDFETNSKEALKLIFKESGLNEQIKEFSSFHMAYKNVNRKLWRMYGVGQVTKEVLRSKRFIDTLANFNIKRKSMKTAITLLSGSMFLRTVRSALGGHRTNAAQSAGCARKLHPGIYIHSQNAMRVGLNSPPSHNPSVR